MGGWSITYHWTTGQVRLPRFRDDDRWAARYGVVAPGVTQIETVQKWGYTRNDKAAFGACDAYDYLWDSGRGEFFVGWNYLLACEPARDLFTATASALPGVTAVDDTRTRMLCLREPIRYERAYEEFVFDESLHRESPALRLFEVVVCSERALQRKRSRFVTGLWTASRGYLHTGEVVLGLEEPWSGTGNVELRVTGEVNLVTARWEGPLAGSPYADRSVESCVAKPAAAWPFR